MMGVGEAGVGSGMAGVVLQCLCKHMKITMLRAMEYCVGTIESFYGLNPSKECW